MLVDPNGCRAVVDVDVTASPLSDYYVKRAFIRRLSWLQVAIKLMSEIELISAANPPQIEPNDIHQF